MDKHRRNVFTMLSITAGLLTGTVYAEQSVISEPTGNGPALKTLPAGEASTLSVSVSPPPLSVNTQVTRPMTSPATRAKHPSVSQFSVPLSEEMSHPTVTAHAPAETPVRVNTHSTTTVQEVNTPESASSLQVVSPETNNRSSIKPEVEPNPPALPPSALSVIPEPVDTSPAKAGDEVDHATVSSPVPSVSKTTANPISVTPQNKVSHPAPAPDASAVIHPSEDVVKVEGKTTPPLAETKFTPSQQAEIEKIMSDYLVAHPEILVKAGETLQAQQAAERKVTMAQAAFENYTELTADPDTPSYGPVDANVVVVTFFDYQSVWSQRLSYEIDRVMKSNPDVRVAFKEWPILGARWPASVEAARTGQQIWYQEGANAYLDYYHGLFALGHTQGELTTADIRKVSTDVKLNSKKAKDVDGLLERNDVLAHKVGFSGTPAVLVMPVVGGDVDTITVIPGYPAESELQAAVKRAREGIKAGN